MVDAAELDDTIAELKDMTGDLEQVRQTMSRAGKTMANPVGAAVDTAKDALLPSKADEPAESAVAAEADEQIQQEIRTAAEQVALESLEERNSE